jgi:hypothetical protein
MKSFLQYLQEDGLTPEQEQPMDDAVNTHRATKQLQDQQAQQRARELARPDKDLERLEPFREPTELEIDKQKADNAIKQWVRDAAFKYGTDNPIRKASDSEFKHLQNLEKQQRDLDDTTNPHYPNA